MVVNEILAIVEKENLADLFMFFCEAGYFSAENTEWILKSGNKYGLIPKIHVNQFTAIRGVQVLVGFVLEKKLILFLQKKSLLIVWFHIPL